MSDKRGTWSKEDRDIIWKDYIENKMWKIFNNLNQVNWDWIQEAPCPKCWKKMLKAQYQGIQPDKDHSWNIDHINGDWNNNNLSNLQPMHPWCNKNKG